MAIWLFVLITYGSTWALNLSQRTAAATGSPEAIYTFLFGTVWTPNPRGVAVDFNARRPPVFGSAVPKCVLRAASCVVARSRDRRAVRDGLASCVDRARVRRFRTASWCVPVAVDSRDAVLDRGGRRGTRVARVPRSTTDAALRVHNRGHARCRALECLAHRWRILPWSGAAGGPAASVSCVRRAIRRVPRLRLSHEPASSDPDTGSLVAQRDPRSRIRSRLCHFGGLSLLEQRRSPLRVLVPRPANIALEPTTQS